MKKKIALGIAALAVPVAGLAVAPSAHADTRTPGCVSYYEWANSVRSTQKVWEATQQVAGLGKVVSYQNGGQQVIRQYPSCGKTEAQGFTQVQYGLNQNGQYMANYVSWWVYGK